MDNEKGSITRNKVAITIAIIILILLGSFYIVQNSTINDVVYFHNVHNQNTGEPISIIGSILLYFLFWWFLGMFPFSILSLFCLCLFYFLHRKDKQLLHKRHYTPKYIEEYYYGCKLSCIFSYVTVLVFMVLHISNIMTINIF